jgi:hypothetical protein
MTSLYAFSVSSATRFLNSSASLSIGFLGLPFGLLTGVGGASSSLCESSKSLVSLTGVSYSFIFLIAMVYFSVFMLFYRSPPRS